MESKLTEWLPKQRWFRSKSRKVTAVNVTDTVPLGPFSLVFVRVEYDGGFAPDDYVLALDKAGNDVLGNPETASLLLKSFGGPALTGKHTTVKLEALPGLAKRKAEAGATFVPKAVATEQTNSSILFGNSFVLKILRQLDEGMSPDLEMGEFLTLAGYEHAPSLAGTIVVERAGREPATMGVLHRFVANQGDAWTYTLEQLREYLAGKTSMDGYLALAELLGRRVGQMHAALDSRTDVQEFAPVPIDRHQRAALVAATSESLENALNTAVEHTHMLDSVAKAMPSIKGRLARFVLMATDPIATRVHGDLHLGQVLFTGDDFVIIDFEGEPARPLAERKAKRSQMVDVAGMIRSFHYAAMTLARENPKSADQARKWFASVREVFLKGWRSAAREPENAQAILDYCLLEKCVYEVSYEANNRPDWIDIPLEGLIS